MRPLPHTSPRPTWPHQPPSSVTYYRAPLNPGLTLYFLAFSFFFNPLSLQEWRQSYRCLPTYCCVSAHHHHPRIYWDPSKPYRIPLSQGLWAFTLLAYSDPTFPVETNALNLCYLTATNPRHTQAIFLGLPPVHSSYSRTTGFLLSPA